MEALRHHKTEQAKLRLLLGPGYEDQGLVCARPDGRPTDPRWVSHAFAVFIARHNLPRIRFHDLRHSHETRDP